MKYIIYIYLSTQTLIYEYYDLKWLLHDFNYDLKRYIEMCSKFEVIKVYE